MHGRPLASIALSKLDGPSSALYHQSNCQMANLSTSRMPKQPNGEAFCLPLHRKYKGPLTRKLCCVSKCSAVDAPGKTDAS